MLQPRFASSLSPTSIGSSSSGVAMVSFQRLRKPNAAMTPTSSTICSSLQYFFSSVNISSLAAFGTPVRFPDRGQELCEPLHHFRLALHDQHAVRNKTERFPVLLERLLQF